MLEVGGHVLVPAWWRAAKQRMRAQGRDRPPHRESGTYETLRGTCWQPRVSPSAMRGAGISPGLVRFPDDWNSGSLQSQERIGFTFYGVIHPAIICDAQSTQLVCHRSRWLLRVRPSVKNQAMSPSSWLPENPVSYQPPPQNRILAVTERNRVNVAPNRLTTVVSL